jgi:arsenate reductase
MAEAFLRKYGGDQFEVYSAGLEPEEIHPHTKRVMDEVGISLAGQYSKHIREYMGKVHFAYLIILCDEAEKNCPARFPGIARRLYWPFENPSDYKGQEDERLEKFKEVRDRIDRRIKSWLEEQKNLSGTG